MGDFYELFFGDAVAAAAAKASLGQHFLANATAILRLEHGMRASSQQPERPAQQAGAGHLHFRPDRVAGQLAVNAGDDGDVLQRIDEVQKIEEGQAFGCAIVGCFANFGIIKRIGGDALRPVGGRGRDGQAHRPLRCRVPLGGRQGRRLGGQYL